MQDFPVEDRPISQVGYHPEVVTGGAEGDDSYASFVMIADAYYACTAVANWRLRGCALISRLRRNAVAFEPCPVPQGPRLYGEKIKLRTLFDAPKERWQQIDSPVYGERDVKLQFLSRDLLWRPLRRMVRFVLVDHPTRGRCICFSADGSDRGACDRMA